MECSEGRTISSYVLLGSYNHNVHTVNMHDKCQSNIKGVRKCGGLVNQNLGFNVQSGRIGPLTGHAGGIGELSLLPI